MRVARLRAAHQVLDAPRIFDDPVVSVLLGLEDSPAPEPHLAGRDRSRFAAVFRASMAARSRYAEDELRSCMDRGVSQYVILGAGLDTFAYRNTHLRGALHVFEADHPATQGWKRSLLARSGIEIPENLTFAALDFECGGLDDALSRAGLDRARPAFFSWLGVTMYLTGEAVEEVLRFVSSMPKGSGIVFDYMIPPELLSPAALRVFDALARRVALTGEPFRTFFAPPVLKAALKSMGFGGVEDLGPEEMDSRYFSGRSDALRSGRLAHVMHARA
jgi:methyltransferase (TIGR00027 family)